MPLSRILAWQICRYSTIREIFRIYSTDKFYLLFWYIKFGMVNCIYQSTLILTELFQHNLINVSYLTACYLYQVMISLHFLNDVANDAESTLK